MNWVKDESYNINRKAFHVEVDGNTIIVVDCWKSFIKQPWRIEIHGWTVPNYVFKWYERFHQQDVLAKVEDVLKNVNAAKFVVFDRIFESKNEI